ncbi:MAG: hypothetical protein JNL98_19595 [Bryobacterales bacterium]|nr:hypothetical protein [Bryobacterales bacterium]
MIRFAMMLLLAGAVPLEAQPFESWHTTDFTYLRGSKQFTLHTQFRSADRFRLLYHGRVGPWFQYLHRGVTYGAAYYYQRNHPSGRELEDSHRPFAWIDFPLLEGPHRVTNRAMYERFLGAARPAFNRYRYQVRYSREGQWTPILSFESFVDHKGLFGWRYSGSIRRALSRVSELHVGYFYDQRRANVGGPRHVVFTNLRFRWGE